MPSIDGVDDWTLVSDPRINPGAEPGAYFTTSPASIP